jgi:hypothetical protein
VMPVWEHVIFIWLLFNMAAVALALQDRRS